MKNKEGRDYIEMSETIASIQDGVVRISDTLVPVKTTTGQD